MAPQAGTPAERPQDETAGERVDESAAGEAPSFKAPQVESAAVEPSPVEPSQVESAAVEASPVEAQQVETPQVESATVEASPGETAVEPSPGETPQVESAAVEASPGETQQVEPSPVQSAAVEASPVESAVETSPVDASQVEPAPVETSSVDAPPIAAPVVDTSPTGPASGEPGDPLPRVVVSGSQDAEDTRSLQTTLDGEGQRSFIARARVLGANAWRAVDLGTGLGDIAIALARALPGLHLMAIDSSAAMLRLARRKQWMMNTNVAFIRGDAQATGLFDRSCDLVLAHGVVHHLADPAALFAEVARIASDDAAIYICDLQRPETPEALERAVEAQAEEWSERQRRRLADAMRASLRVDEVRALCDAAGLTGVEVRLSGEHRWEVVRARRR